MIKGYVRLFWFNRCPKCGLKTPNNMCCSICKVDGFDLHRLGSLKTSHSTKIDIWNDFKKEHKKHSKIRKIEDAQCPVCGYYCLGNGGKGCIDKKSMFENELKND